MSTPTPTPAKLAELAETPRTDAALHNVLAVFKQYHDGHIYLADLEGFIAGAVEPFRTLERDLTQLRAENERLKAEAGVVAIPEAGVPPDKWLRVGPHQVTSLRDELKRANEILEAINRAFTGDQDYEHTVLLGKDPSNPDCVTPAKLVRTHLKPKKTT